MNSDVQNLLGRIKAWYLGTDARLKDGNGFGPSAWMAAKIMTVLIVSIVVLMVLHFIHPLLMWAALAMLVVTLAVWVERSGALDDL